MTRHPSCTNPQGSGRGRRGIWYAGMSRRVGVGKEPNCPQGVCYKLPSGKICVFTKKSAAVPAAKISAALTGCCQPKTELLRMLLKVCPAEGVTPGSFLAQTEDQDQTFAAHTHLKPHAASHPNLTLSALLNPRHSKK